MLGANPTPTLRFDGFTDPWEQRKLGELGFAQSGIGFPDAEQGGTEGTPFFKVSDMSTPGNEYELVASNNYVTAEQIARMGWRPINQVPAVFFAKVGAAVMLNRKRLVNKPFLLDNNTMAFSMNSSLLDTQFGRSLFERLDLTSLIQVGALPSFNSSDVESMSVSLPSTMNEQRQIGQYLCDLNTLITLHQRKCDRLKHLKAAMLDKMFPKPGERYPELRFEGFTDPWEQRKLGEFGSVAMCKRIYKEQTSEQGDVPFFKIGTFGADPDAFISNELFEDFKRTYPYPAPGTLLISAAGSIGRVVEYQGEKAYFQDSNIVWLEHDHRLNDAFLKPLYSQIEWGLEGSTIKRLYNKDLLSAEVTIPDGREQKEIGQFFAKLDSLITLHQRKCERLRHLKAAMLDKMFV